MTDPASKPIVLYSAAVGVDKGEHALVEALGHHKHGTKRIITSRVVKVSNLSTKIGPKFETLNTVYLPKDWLEPGALHG